MLIETGRIVGIEETALWVETLQKSVCAQCTAKSACGHNLLSKAGNKSSYLRVLNKKTPPTQYRLNDIVTIGIPEDVIVKGSLISYLVPLILLFVFLGIAHTLTLNSFSLIAISTIGLMIGGFVVRGYSHYYRNDERFQPIVINDDVTNIHMPINNYEYYEEN